MSDGGGGRRRMIAGWAVVAAVAVLALAAPAGAARAASPALHCTNTSSGATWDIPVNLAGSTVDQAPARITARHISWEDSTRHFYDFDRRTGLLDMHAASSTGGFYLTDRCVFN